MDYQILVHHLLVVILSSPMLFVVGSYRKLHLSIPSLRLIKLMICASILNSTICMLNSPSTVLSHSRLVCDPLEVSFAGVDVLAAAVAGGAEAIAH